MPDAACVSRLFRHPAAPGLCVLALPAAALAFGTGGWPALLSFLLAFPVALMASCRLRTAAEDRDAKRDPLTGLLRREGAVAELDRGLRSGRAAGALILEIDGFRQLEEFHEHAVLERVLRLTSERLLATLGPGDLPVRLDGASFAVTLPPPQGGDLEAALQLAGRLQRALSEPIPLDGTSLPLTASLGLALSPRLRAPTGEGLLHAATLALIEAQRTGPAAMRSYSDALRHRVETRGHLAGEVASAIERGEVQAYFQPQISTRTGAITGFEALARWQHPTRGLLPPSEFLPAIEQAGLMTRLGERMLCAALSALRDWEREGLHIPCVGVNFSNAELCDPRLVERIAWELDRFGLTADRLVVEVSRRWLPRGARTR
jgi:diguanylate cyclase (GGDEF)-like protein